MAENAMGKLLPNLKIIVGNESDSDNQTEEGEISDAMEDIESLPNNEVEKKNVNVIRTWMNSLKDPKVYENKAGAFITGLDLSSETLVKKLQERAERFGLEKKETITQIEIDALYKSLGIDPENLNTCKLKNIRLESLHMRGIEEMNTNEIFAYFKEYGPASVEWINDFACNVVWMDASTTARAMIGLSRPLILKKKGTTNQGIAESLCKEDEVKGSEAEDIIEMSDSAESDSSDKKEFDESVEDAMEIDSQSDTEKPTYPETKNDSSEEPSEVVDVPVPPGYWRLGVPHPKSRALLLRFATKDDKKLPGAEKRSQYYKKYGNPNYGGLKGLISLSRKRKIQAARNRQVVEKLTEDSTTQSEINSGETSNRAVIKASRTKMPRMKMYADEEEEKKRKGSFLRFESGRKSVHSRLGTKYTKEDLCQLGNRFSSESEEEDDNISINCTVPSRYNVWTDIAKTMAKEDRWRPQSSTPDDKPYDYYKYGNDRARQYRSLARDRYSESAWGSRPRSFARDQSPEFSRGSRPRSFARDQSPEFGRGSRPRSFARDQSPEPIRDSRPRSFVRDQSPESMRGSRPWRPSRDESPEDLRSSLSSRKYQSPLNRPDEDLRSKIKRIKKEENVDKHRSPMYLYD